jgi:hypothetical protein
MHSDIKRRKAMQSDSAAIRNAKQRKTNEAMHSDAKRHRGYKAIQCKAKRRKAMQSDAKRCKAMQSDAKRCATQSNEKQYEAMRNAKQRKTI